MVYLPLYDALYLYGLALRSAVDETGNEYVAHDGNTVWSKMIDRDFVGLCETHAIAKLVILYLGVSGSVLMNHIAVRVPSYAAYFVRKGLLTIVMELEAKLTNCSAEGQISSGCSKIVRVAFWSS
jgi:hypothetical protein